MEWLFLALAALLYGVGCWLTYANDLKKFWWYIPLGVFFGCLINVVWFVAAKAFPDKHRMYIFSLLWDAGLMLIYYGLPLLLFGVKVNRWTVGGMMLIVVGAAIIKLKS